MIIKSITVTSDEIIILKKRGEKKYNLCKLKLCNSITNLVDEVLI